MKLGPRNVHWWQFIPVKAAHQAHESQSSVSSWFASRNLKKGGRFKTSLNLSLVPDCGVSCVEVSDRCTEKHAKTWQNIYVLYRDVVCPSISCNCRLIRDIWSDLTRLSTIYQRCQLLWEKKKNCDQPLWSVFFHSLKSMSQAGICMWGLRESPAWKKTFWRACRVSNYNPRDWLLSLNPVSVSYNKFPAISNIAAMMVTTSVNMSETGCLPIFLIDLTQLKQHSCRGWQFVGSARFQLFCWLKTSDAELLFVCYACGGEIPERCCIGWIAAVGKRAWKQFCQVSQEDKLVISHKTGQQDVRDPTVGQTQ